MNNFAERLSHPYLRQWMFTEVERILSQRLSLHPESLQTTGTHVLVATVALGFCSNQERCQRPVQSLLVTVMN